MADELEKSFDGKVFKEDQKTEFKTSIFYSPDKALTEPGINQMATIAKTMAAFMNTNGGILYIGVKDSGEPIGIYQDLVVLKSQREKIVLKTPQFNDEKYEYFPNPDHYELKIRNIVKALLSPNAVEYVGDIRTAQVLGKEVCRVVVKACRPGDVVYFNEYIGPRQWIKTRIYVRNGNQNEQYKREKRDAFIRKCTKEEVKETLAAMPAQEGVSPELVAMIAQIVQRLDATPTVVGTKVVVEGALALDDENFKELESPKGLVFDGAHVCDVKGWKGAYEALILKLNEIAPEKFDDLPTMDFFKKYFIHPEPRKPYSKYIKTRLGEKQAVRAKEMSGKVYFTNPAYVVHRLLKHFEIELSRVMFRG